MFVCLKVQVMEKRCRDLVARVDNGYEISQKHRNWFMVSMERWPADPSTEYPPITLYSASLLQPGPTFLTSLWTTRKQEQVKCLQVVWKLDPPQPLHSVVLIIIFSNIFSPSFRLNIWSAISGGIDQTRHRDIHITQNIKDWNKELKFNRLKN